jgi:hypothetical protein
MISITQTAMPMSSMNDTMMLSLPSGTGAAEATFPSKMKLVESRKETGTGEPEMGTSGEK